MTTTNSHERQRSRERVPPRKTTSRTWRRWPWPAPASCVTRDGRPRSPSRSPSGRVGANGPACSKRAERCGKRSTAMRPPPGRAPARRSRLAGAATWTMPRRSRWPSRVICRNRERLAADLAARVPGGYVRSVHVSADAAGPVLVERSRSGSSDSGAADRLALRPRPRRRRFRRTFRRPVPHLRARNGLPRRPSTRRSRRRVPADSRSSQHRARRSHGRDGAPAAGESARRSRATRRRRRASTRDLLTLWKNADAEVPMVEQARTEYARLR